MHSSMQPSPNLLVRSNYPNVYNSKQPLPLPSSNPQHSSSDLQPLPLSLPPPYPQPSLQSPSTNILQILPRIPIEDLSLLFFAKNISRIIQYSANWARLTATSWLHALQGVQIIKILRLSLKKLPWGSLKELGVIGKKNRLVYYLKVVIVVGLAIMAIRNRHKESRRRKEPCMVLAKKSQEEETNITDQLSIDERGNQKDAFQPDPKNESTSDNSMF